MRHLEQVHHVCVDKSSVAGLGLFTTAARVCGDRVVTYTGDVVQVSEEEEHVGGPYHLEFRTGFLIDASNPTSCAGRYINDARPSSSHTCKRGRSSRSRKRRNTIITTLHDNNCSFILDESTDIVWAVANRSIQAGEELFVSYQEDYWDYV